MAIRWWVRPRAAQCGSRRLSFGITAAGGTGYYLAQMMVEGEAEIDMASLDPFLRQLDDHRICGSKNANAMSTSISYTTPMKSAKACRAAPTV